MKKEEKIIFLILQIAMIISLFLPLIIINGKKFSIIEGNGKVIMILSTISLMSFIRGRYKLVFIPNIASLIILFKFYLENNKINGLISQNNGVYSLFIISLISMEIILIDIIRKTSEKREYKTCPNCGATILKDNTRCFMCDYEMLEETNISNL